MSFSAKVVKVMIASPSDTTEDRDTVEEALHGWNGANSENKGIILLPWRWETNSIPTLGGDPQSLINSQIVDNVDIIFALFGSKLGSPTLSAVSGTVEEIERAENKGIPVHIYFSTAPVPLNQIDTEQLEGLNEFKREIGKRSLYREYSSSGQLSHEIWKAIEYDIPQMGIETQDNKEKGEVKLTLQPYQEEIMKGQDSRGKMKYQTKRWMEITNHGGLDAEEVTFHTNRNESSAIIAEPDHPTVIHAGQSRRINYSRFMSSLPATITVNWKENGDTKSKVFHID